MLEAIYNQILEALHTTLNNQLAQAGVVTVLLSGLLYKIKPICSSITGFLRKRITSSVTYYDFKADFENLVEYIQPHINERHYNNIGRIGDGRYYSFVCGRPAIIQCSTIKLENQFYYSVHIEAFFCKNLAKRIRKDLDDTRNKNIVATISSDGSRTYKSISLEQITLPTKNCQKLYKLAKAFYESKLKKLGIILYGPPGNGKSQAILNTAKALKKNIIVLSITKETKVYSLYDGIATADNCIIVIEDIDRLTLAKEENKQNDKFLLTKADLLNALDGMLSPNCLIIATANNYDDIDKAILRHGRFDVHMEFNKPSDEDIKSIYIDNYKEHCPQSFIEQARGKTTAEVYNIIKMDMLENLKRETI